MNKIGRVTQIFSNGDFAVWSEEDKKLYQYNLPTGQNTVPLQTRVHFAHEGNEIIKYELVPEREV